MSMFFFVACQTVFAAPTVNVITPNGGETYVQGDLVHISWISQNVDSVTISYSSCTNCFTAIASNIQNTNSYTWKADIGDEQNRSVFLVVTGYQNGKQIVNDYSDSPIVILKEAKPPKTTTPSTTKAGTATTQQAMEITTTTAQLQGTASANGTEGMYTYFEILQSGQLFSTTEKVPLAATNNTYEQKKRITKLSPDTVYSYRLITEKGTLRTEGDLKFFKTEKIKTTTTPSKEENAPTPSSEHGTETTQPPYMPQDSTSTQDTYIVSPEQVVTEKDLQQFKNRILLKYPSISSIYSQESEGDKTEVTIRTQLQGTVFGFIPHTFETQMSVQSTTNGTQVTFTQPWWCLLTFGTITHKDEIITHLAANDVFSSLLEASSTPQTTAKIIDIAVTELGVYF